MAVHPCIWVCVHLCVGVCVCMYVCMCVFIWVHIWVKVYVYVCVQLSADQRSTQMSFRNHAVHPVELWLRQSYAGRVFSFLSLNWEIKNRSANCPWSPVRNWQDLNFKSSGLKFCVPGQAFLWPQCCSIEHFLLGAVVCLLDLFSVVNQSSVCFQACCSWLGRWLREWNVWYTRIKTWADPWHSGTSQFLWCAPPTQPSEVRVSISGSWELAD